MLAFLDALQITLTVALLVVGAIAIATWARSHLPSDPSKESAPTGQSAAEPPAPQLPTRVNTHDALQPSPTVQSTTAPIQPERREPILPQGTVTSRDELRARLASSQGLRKIEERRQPEATVRRVAEARLAAPKLISPYADKIAWAIDCETTGLQSDDRIVSFGGAEIRGDTPTGRIMYLVFDPGRNSHPRAREKHGWSDCVLRHQPFFGDYAAAIHQILSGAYLVVGHNLAFDLDLLGRELRGAGQPALRLSAYCTMRAFQERFVGQRASLDSCVARIGGSRQGRLHGALEDAVLAMSLYRWLAFGHAQSISLETRRPPTNLQECPPEPPRPWPSRKRRARL